MTAWVIEKCHERPEELQLIAPELYAQRRNITEVVDEETGVIYYECEYREISISAYEFLKSVEEIDTQKAIDEYTSSLIEEGVL